MSSSVRSVYVIRNGRERRLPNARANRPADDICDDCGASVSIGTFPACGGDPAKHGPVHSHRFPEFEIEIDGRVQRITSLQDADRLERESWARYNSFDDKGRRRGSPSVLRLFHQNWSNRDRNTLDGVGLRSEPMRPFNSRGERLRYGPRKGDD